MRGGTGPTKTRRLVAPRVAGKRPGAPFAPEPEGHAPIGGWGFSDARRAPEPGFGGLAPAVWGWLGGRVWVRKRDSFHNFIIVTKVTKQRKQSFNRTLQSTSEPEVELALFGGAV